MCRATGTMYLFLVSESAGIPGNVKRITVVLPRIVSVTSYRAVSGRFVLATSPQ